MRREQQEHQAAAFVAYLRKHEDADFFATFDRWANSKMFTAADRMAIGRIAHERLQEPPAPTLTEILDRATGGAA